jgi:flagellar hook-associated protein 1 FlgK
MTATSSIVNAALSGMRSYQAAIAVTGANIANVNTEGYSRQVVVIQARTLQSSGGSQVLSGSQMTAAQRAVDAFGFAQLLKANQAAGRWETEANYLAAVEALVDESEDSGLSNALDEFWNQWDNLVDNPSGYAERAAVIEAAQELAEEFNQLAGGLKDVQTQIDQDVASSVNDVNDLTRRIADLNAQLVKAGAMGDNTNTIEDSIDELTNQLSSLVSIQTHKNDQGQTCIQLAGGQPLVNGSRSWSLGTEVNASTGRLDVTWADGSGTAKVVNGSIRGGTLGGCLAVRDDLIAGYLDSLDDLASTLINQVNSLLTAGYDQNGQAGLALFTGTGALDMAVNQTVAADPTLIAASDSAAGAPGDGSAAEAIADLRASKLMSGGTATIEEAYSALVSGIGSDVGAAEDEQDQQQSLALFYRNYLESITGVESDEESANLVLFQEAYEASAKVMSVLQEILQTLVEL